jgi:hypothetical protein
MPAAWELSDNNVKLMIGMPHKDTVTMDWCLGFRNLQVNVPSSFTVSRGTPIDMARNEIVRSALDAKAEWVFFLDTDVICPPDTIARLMSHNLPIVTGVYYTRAPPIEPAIWHEVKPSGKRAINFTSGQMVECDFIGMGCCLIHTSVFKNLKKPYFEWTLSFEDTENIGVGRSEDFEFCKRVRERGYKIWADTSISCRHGISNAFTENGTMQISQI